MLRIAVVPLTVAILAGQTETYRLVQALGNTEHVVAKGLSKTACEKRKRELIATATALGTYNEGAGLGSITCLPDSFFED